jgi:hypothetical protein
VSKYRLKVVVETFLFTHSRTEIEENRLGKERTALGKTKKVNKIAKAAVAAATAADLVIQNELEREGDMFSFHAVFMYFMNFSIYSHLCWTLLEPVLSSVLMRLLPSIALDAFLEGRRA